MTSNYQSLEQLLADINTLTVPQLREKSREFGIVPRNRKRDELIDLIKASYLGKIEPEEPKKSGRPTKRNGKVAQPEAALEENNSADNVDKSLPRCGILE
ncbi:MAG: hypothetical protein ACI4QH_01675, partial [Candidatus Fimimonas sp.]